MTLGPKVVVVNETAETFVFIVRSQIFIKLTSNNRVSRLLVDNIDLN